MGDIIVIAISVLLLIIAFVGCFVHKVPGPLIALISILIFRFGCDAGEVVSTTAILLCVLAVILSMVLNHLMPKLTKRLAQFGAGGKWGAVLGSLLGLILLASFPDTFDSFFGAVAMLILCLGVLPYGFAFLGELIARKNAAAALKPAFASYLTYLSGLIINLAVCFYCVYTMFMVND